jgi:hypothetical protein
MFIPRHPVVENQFCKYGETNVPGGAGNVVAYAGSVVYLDPAATNEESVVRKMEYGVTETPFGFCMQKVKTGYHSVHPVGMVLPGDLGSSDAIAQPTYDATGNIDGTQAIPVGVAHLGIWDTVHYTCVQTTTPGTVDAGDQMVPGQSLYAAADEAKVTNSTVDATGTDDNGERCNTTVVARVLKGASAAKCTANIQNSTLYPIRVKLMV